MPVPRAAVQQRRKTANNNVQCTMHNDPHHLNAAEQILRKPSVNQDDRGAVLREDRLAPGDAAMSLRVATGKHRSEAAEQILCSPMAAQDDREAVFD